MNSRERVTSKKCRLIFTAHTCRKDPGTIDQNPVSQMRGGDILGSIVDKLCFAWLGEIQIDGFRAKLIITCSNMFELLRIRNMDCNSDNSDWPTYVSATGMWSDDALQPHTSGAVPRGIWRRSHPRPDMSMSYRADRDATSDCWETLAGTSSKQCPQQRGDRTRMVGSGSDNLGVPAGADQH